MAILLAVSSCLTIFEPLGVPWHSTWLMLVCTLYFPHYKLIARSFTAVYVKSWRRWESHPTYEETRTHRDEMPSPR